MPIDRRRPRGSHTFTLRGLFIAVAILAIPMAVTHYYVHGSEWFRSLLGVAAFLGALMFVLCSPTLAGVAMDLCQRRGRAMAIMAPAVVVLILLLALATQLLLAARYGH